MRSAGTYCPVWNGPLKAIEDRLDGSQKRPHRLAHPFPTRDIQQTVDVANHAPPFLPGDEAALDQFALLVLNLNEFVFLD